jgi:hypothetical protein
MPQGLRLLIRFTDEIQFDLYFEFSPPCLGHFKGGRLDGTESVRVGFVELELHLFEPVGYVFAVDAFDPDRPFMGVFGGEVGGFLVWVDGVRDAAENWYGELGLGVVRSSYWVMGLTKWSEYLNVLEGGQ